MKLSNMTDLPTGKGKSEPKGNNYTYTREDSELGTQAEFDLTPYPDVVEKLEALLNKRITTKSGKEVYAVLTFPRGSIKLNGQVLNGVRMGLNMFADASE
jgi:hypothetical protein